MIPCSSTMVTERVFLIHHCVIVVWQLKRLNIFLLHCSKYDTERQGMMAYIEDTGYGIMNNGRFRISESLLLAPSPDNVSKKDNTITKEALFQFLEKSQRNV